MNQDNPALADFLLASKDVATNPVTLEDITPKEPSYSAAPVTVDDIDEIGSEILTIVQENIDEPLDSVVVVMPADSTPDEVQTVIDEFKPKTEELTIAVGSKIIPPGTDTVDEKIIESFPDEEDIVQTVIDKNPTVVIPIITENNVADLISLEETNLPVAPIFIGEPIISHVEPVKVDDINDMKSEIDRASTCEVLFGPGSVQKITKRVLVLLPNQIVSYPSVKNFVYELHQMTPGNVISLVLGSYIYD